MISGIPTLAYRGVNAPNPPNFMSFSRAPTPNDADFPLGTIWLNEANQAVYMLVKFNGSVNGVTALWSILASGSTGNVTLIGNAGTATEDVLGNINVFGDTPNIQVTGDNVNTLTVILNDDITLDSLNLPDTTAAFGAGYISFNNIPWIHDYRNNVTRDNVFMGPSTGNAVATLTGGENVGFGPNVLTSVTAGEGNSALGSEAATALTSSDFNTALGWHSLNSLTTGAGGNIAIGPESLSLLDDGAFNIAIGNQAGSSYTGTETNNICIGTTVSGTLGESGVMRLGDNGVITDTFIAGIWNTNIDATNQAVLVDANGQLGTGPAGTVTFDNINLPNTNPAVPEGYINYGGNRFIHNFGTSNTFVGQNSANTTLTASQSVALGTNVLQGLTNGNGNTVVGALSATALTTGVGNTFVGSSVASASIVTGDSNVALGSSCFAALTSGDNNVAIGSTIGGASLDGITTGSNNIGINGGTSYATGSESNNICIGNDGVNGESGIMRLGSNGTITDTFIAGETNVELGLVATTGNVQTDNGNMIVGSTSNDANANALIFLKQRISSTVQTGDTLGNIDFRGLDGTSYIPAAAISSTVAGTVGVNQVGGTLEFYTTQAIAAASPSLRMTIDQDGTITTDISGGNTDAIIVQNGDVTLSNGDVVVSDGNLTVSGASSVVTFSNVPGTAIANDIPLLINSVTGELGTTPSSARYKNNIVDMGEISSPIMQLRPVTFTMKADKSNQLRYGLIAEEVDQILPGIVGYQKDGQPDYVRYHDLPCMLLNELQKQQRVIADLLNRVKILEDASSVN